jgi:isopentenyl-diphosphate delta-isomerase
METAWVPFDRLAEEVADAPTRFTPWLRIYLSQHGHLVLPG